jgi:hypothetical protein
MTKPNFFVKNVDLGHCNDPENIRNMISKVQKDHKIDINKKRMHKCSSS